MKYYLSSYKLGNKISKFKSLIQQTSGKFAYIPNALDFTDFDVKKKANHIESDLSDLRNIGVEAEILNLKDYFGKENELSNKLLLLDGLYVSGGNTFILRQAMYLSGLDKIITGVLNRKDFVYAGYSAAACVLSLTLRSYAITDDATNMPYPEIKEQIWEGLGILDFVFQPHYKSNHPESKSTNKEIQYCIDNKILFKAYRDGEVLIIE